METGVDVRVNDIHLEGQRGTFTQFFEESGSYLVRLSYLLVGNSADAEDVAQEVLEEMLRKWTELRPETVLAYARTAVVNRSRSLHRRRAVARKWAPRLAEPENVAPLAVEDRWLWDVVQRLPRRQREVIVLRYWCDLTEADIARVLGISCGTVKSSAHRAHTHLAAVLQETVGVGSGSRKGVQ